MIEPGKQHNLRVLRDAEWTEDFNRLLAVSGLSANRLLNHLIQTGIATLDVTGQKGRLAIVTSEELNHLLERRSGLSTGRPAAQPIATLEPVAEIEKEDSQPEAPINEPVQEKEAPVTRRPTIKQKNPRQKVQLEGNVLDTFHKFQGE